MTEHTAALALFAINVTFMVDIRLTLLPQWRMYKMTKRYKDPTWVAWWVNGKFLESGSAMAIFPMHDHHMVWAISFLTFSALTWVLMCLYIDRAHSITVQTKTARIN